MPDYTLKLHEQETTVTMSRDMTLAKIYTSDRLVMAKLDKLCEMHPDAYACVWTDSQIMGDGLPMGKKYTAQKSRIRFAKPASEKKREAARRSAMMARTFKTT